MDVFRATVGRSLTEYGSHGAAWAPLSSSDGACHVGFVRLEPGGRVGMHPAPVDQLFMVVDGTGWVEVPGREPVHVIEGDIAVWRAGEEHTSSSDTGMVALVIQAEAMQVGEEATDDVIIRLDTPAAAPVV